MFASDVGDEEATPPGRGAPSGDFRRPAGAAPARVVDRYEGVPPHAETQAYVAAIMARLANGPGEA
jgi:hypothetical protein